MEALKTCRGPGVLLMLAAVQFLCLPRLHATTPDTELTDRNITTAVEEGLIHDRGVYPDTVNVSTRDGIVTLAGSVDNVLAKDRATAIAESVRGVLGVITVINVSPVSRPDEAIHQDIATALLEDPATETYHVAASVHKAVVTLTGTVGSYAEKRLAERIAEGVRGVKKIQNDIAVNYLTKRTDEEIAADINSRLQWDIWLDGGHIRATVTDGAVTLTGAVGSAISKSRATDDAWVNGVTSVDDSGLRVEPAARKEWRRTAYAAPDSEIKKAIIAALHFDPRVSAFSLEVNVEDGVVILGGAVGNVKASMAAEEDARNIVGVWRVQNFLKVQPSGKLTDAELEKQLKAAMFWDPLLGGAKIEAAVINRVAYLSGEVELGQERAEAEDVASRVKGLLAVRNRITVAPEHVYYYYDWPFYAYGDWSYYYNQPPDSISLGPYPSDRQIKKEIEKSLFWSPFVDRHDITVKVHGGVAILTGAVRSWIGWNEAGRDAREHAAFVINHIEVRRHHWL